MSKKLLFLIMVIIVSILGAVIWVAPLLSEWKKDSKTTVEDVVDKAVENRTAEILSTSTLSITEAVLKDQKIINILLLGLDSRKSATSSHCDAIHMFSLDVEKWTIKITSVPRGTYVYIPPGNYPPGQYYLSNACRLAGQDYTIKQIEKLLGIKADFVVKVGFSQTLGILRLLKLPTTESLQWLRDRQSFGIGDPQRSHNQAVFMKDVIIKTIGPSSAIAMLPLTKIGFSFADSNLSFPYFYALLRGYAENDLAKHPERITLTMKPYFATVDYHLDLENPEKSLTKFPLPAVIRTSTQSIEAVQADLIKYLKGRIAEKNNVQDILDKRLWLQIEDERVREEIHFQLIKKQLTYLKDPKEVVYLLDNYIFEKQYLDLTEWADRGKELLKTVSQ